MHYHSTCVVTTHIDTRFGIVRHVLFRTLHYIRQKAKHGSKRHWCDKRKFCINKLQPKLFIKNNQGHTTNESNGLPKNYFLTLLPESVIHCHIPSYSSDMRKQISPSLQTTICIRQQNLCVYLSNILNLNYAILRPLENFKYALKYTKYNQSLPIHKIQNVQKN